MYCKLVSMSCTCICLDANYTMYVDLLHTSHPFLLLLFNCWSNRSTWLMAKLCFLRRLLRMFSRIFRRLSAAADKAHSTVKYWTRSPTFVIFTALAAVEQPHVFLHVAIEHRCVFATTTLRRGQTSFACDHWAASTFTRAIITHIAIAPGAFVVRITGLAGHAVMRHF